MRWFDQLPFQISRYTIVRPLGRGGMGTVYEALDTQLERRVAFKVPCLGRDDAEQLLRFRREAKAAANLQHPNICSVYDLGEVDGVPYLVMAFIEGRPLTKLMREGEPMPLAIALPILLKLADALQAAHNRGVVHRDIKPDNILLDSRNEPILVDFGLALRTGQRTPKATPAGVLVGTPEYMPPEQARGDAHLMDHHYDIYSMGVLLFEMLTGRRPFDAPNPAAVVAQILTREVPRLSKIRPDLDRRFETICLKAMAREISARYDSMAEFAADLAPLVVTTPSGVPARSPWPWLVGGQLTVLGGVAGVAASLPGLVAAAPLAAVGSAALALVPTTACWAIFRKKRERPIEPASPVATPLPASLASSMATPSPADRETQDSLRLQNVRLTQELETHKKLVQELTVIRQQYEQAKKMFAKTYATRTYSQPVLIVGPRSIGKTSLVKQWEAPWNYAEVEGSKSHRVCELFVDKFEDKEPAPHETAPDLLVKQRTYLYLRVHDFPGEIQAQQHILEQVKEETKKLRKSSKKQLGVVVICMFDAEEAKTGISPKTQEYYNGALFRELRQLVAADTVGIERLILVFNKADLLREHYAHRVTDAELQEICLRAFAETLGPLRGIVERERVCEVLTVLAREEQMYKSSGANFVKGEAARALVETFRGSEVASGKADLPDAPLGL